MILFWDSKLSWKLDQKINPHEANFLSLDCSKAKMELNWYPKWDLEYSLKLIVDWHKTWLFGEM